MGIYYNPFSDKFFRVTEYADPIDVNYYVRDLLDPPYGDADSHGRISDDQRYEMRRKVGDIHEVKTELVYLIEVGHKQKPNSAKVTFRLFSDSPNRIKRKSEAETC